MKIQITARNFELTPAIEDIIEQKFTLKIEKLLNGHSGKYFSPTLAFEKDKYGTYYGKFKIQLAGQENIIFSESKHIDLIGLITDLREQVERQIEKYKASFDPTS